MRFNFGLTKTLAKHIISNKLKGNKYFALVLMLEPTFKCNLSCQGCGRIREYSQDLNKMLSVKECTDAANECGAKIVSICGGEPLVYPYISELVNSLVEKGIYVYLCTNGVLLKERIGDFKANGHLMINFHVDGLAKTHDAITGLEGSYDKVVEAIRAAKAKGFFACTNTTVYKGTDPHEMKALFKNLDELEVDGFLISPAYEYVHVGEKIFLNRQETSDFFKILAPEFKRYRFLNSPLYIEFLQGKRSLKCSPWANPTRNPYGWRSPCYQMADRHFASYKELINQTDWSRYGPTGTDTRCKECTVHCGFEPTCVLEGNSFWDTLKILKWQLF